MKSPMLEPKNNIKRQWLIKVEQQEPPNAINVYEEEDRALRNPRKQKRMASKRSLKRSKARRR